MSLILHDFVRSKSFTRTIFIGISSSPCSLRGVSGDVPEAGQGAAPAGRVRDPALGRPGAPPGGHYGLPAESRLIRPAQAVLESAARAEKSRGGAPRGAPAGVIGRLISGLPRRSARPRGGPRVRGSAPSACRRSAPLILGGATKGSKPRAQKFAPREGEIWLRKI